MRTSWLGDFKRLAHCGRLVELPKDKSPLEIIRSVTLASQCGIIRSLDPEMGLQEPRAIRFHGERLSDVPVQKGQFK